MTPRARSGAPDGHVVGAPRAPSARRAGAGLVRSGGAPQDASPSRAVDAALRGAGLHPHRPVAGEWGLVMECGGGPLHVGLALRDGLLRAVAEVCGPGLVEPAWLLHRNRRDLLLVRYGTGADGGVWLHGELHPAGVTPAAVDELLARLHGAAEAAREVAWAGGRPTWASG